MKDDITGEDLIQRSDDTEPVLRKRLNAYHQYTSGVLGYYRSYGLLTVIDAEKKPDNVWGQIMKALGI